MVQSGTADLRPIEHDCARFFSCTTLCPTLEEGEVVHDPGCTAETGSKEAWEGLDLAIQTRYGTGFATEDSAAKFCVANGAVSTALKSYSAAFEIPDKGIFVLAGSALPRGDDPKRHTPILLSNPTCEALDVVSDHTTGDLYSKRLDVTVRCRKTLTGHWALPNFDLLDRATTVISKNMHPRAVQTSRAPAFT